MAGALFSIFGASAVETGSVAPDFQIKAAKAGQVEDFKLSSALSKGGPVVVYFFPAAFTSGCNREAHEFAEKIPEFTAAGATVIGVSTDTIDTISKFSVQECAGKFLVGADTDGAVMKAYDTKIPLVNAANRVSFVVAPDGKVIYRYASQSPSGHITGTLDAIKSWQATVAKK